MLERIAAKQIQEWFDHGQLALLVAGARQTGKTYLIRELLKQNDCDFVEINFIERPELVKLLEGATDTSEFLMRLSVATDHTLTPGKTIFFLDEIQEFKDVVTRIKFLVQDGRFRYIMSGSLLGVELRDLRSVPVGYMQILDMYPMNFKEFSIAAGLQDNVFDHLEKCYKNRIPVDELVHQKLMDLFRLYLIVGGMPLAVSTYLDTKDLQRVSQVHQMILKLYKQDFTKYEMKYKLQLQEIFDAIPSELNAPNKRFKLNLLGDGMSYDRIKNDFLWLKDAGVALPVYNVTEPKLPLLSSTKRSLFKLFQSDVGLLTSQYSNTVKMQILNNDPSINNGALYENVVAQELVSAGIIPYYFNSKQQGELDFIIELEGKVLPIEVKSGKDYKKHSALDNVLTNRDYAIPEAVILCNDNVSVCAKRVYLPIYMIMFLKEAEPNQIIYSVDLNGLNDVL